MFKIIMSKMFKMRNFQEILDKSVEYFVLNRIYQTSNQLNFNYFISFYYKKK